MSPNRYLLSSMLSLIAIMLSASTGAFAQFIFTTIDVPGQGLSAAQATAINNTGESAGYFIDAYGEHGYIRSRLGHVTVIDGPAIAMQIGGINDAGAIAGFGGPGGAGFIRDASGNYTLFFGPSGQGVLSVVSLTNAGESIVRDGSTLFYYVRTPSDQYTLLPPFPPNSSSSSVYNALNDNGQVVGTIYPPDFTRPEGFVLDLGSGIYTQFQVDGLPTLATGINDRGDVVGTYDGQFARLGFVRSADGKRVDTFYPSLNLQDFVTAELNQAGQFVASQSGEHPVPFFATPTSDNTPPSISLIKIVPGPPKQAVFSVVDPQSGIFLVDPTATNAKVVAGPVRKGQTAPVTVTATKIDQSQNAAIMIQASDVAGNYTVFSPQVVTVSGGIDAPAITGSASGDHIAVVANDNPGITRLYIDVNGSKSSYDLSAGETKTIPIYTDDDAGGDNNTITFSRPSFGCLDSTLAPSCPARCSTDVALSVSARPSTYPAVP